jgi:GH35 family endo-1,4-beta-xylanase
MRTMLVGYDLNRPGQNYPALYEALKAVPLWWHYLDSTWLLRTEESAADLRNRLMRHIDAGDELLVIDVTNPEAAWAGFDSRASQWLSDNL